MRRALETPNAPRAVGPYSPGVEAGNLVFTAGQVAIDPAKGKLIEGSVGEQTHQALRNLKAILEAAGVSLDDVAKTTVFLTAMSDFGAMNEAYSTYFKAPFPARSTVAVKELPLGALVEIEAIAVRP